MNDYELIYTVGAEGGLQRVEPIQTNGWWERDKDWLELSLSNRSTPCAVVLTHHAPTFNGSSQATALSDLLLFILV